MRAFVASMLMIWLVVGGTLALVTWLAEDGARVVGRGAAVLAGVETRLTAATVAPTPTPRVVAAPVSLVRVAATPTATPTSTPETRLFSRTVPEPTKGAPTPQSLAAAALPSSRAGCDPAYPEERTCIPPGPPFNQGCAITDQRLFKVLPPDPQRLDSDGDGIGCEPIAAGS